MSEPKPARSGSLLSYLAMALAAIVATGWVLSCSGSSGGSQQDACQRLCDCGLLGSSTSSSTGADTCVDSCVALSASTSSSAQISATCLDCIAGSTCTELGSGGACAVECGGSASSL